MKLRQDNPALSEHQTVFPYRVKTVAEVKRVLQSVANNSKLGNGVPRDVVEFSHADTGLQIGTIRVHAVGKLTTDYIWD